jgi:serine/threonine protein kinase/DNA-binding beta-propeller fold protein YncE
VSEEPRGGLDQFAAGSVVAGYWLEERIGLGADSVVFRAYARRLDRRVALKILVPEPARDEGFRPRFLRAWRATAAVDNPHIIPVFEAGEDRGALFVAMRLVEGGDVRSRLDREGLLAPDRAVEVVSQAASALDAAHARGLVHGDVRPASLLVDSGGDGDRPDHVYLSGFWLLGESRPAGSQPPAGRSPGPLDYAAPEVLAGRPADGRTDQYALACTAFELVTGAPPFRREQGTGDHGSAGLQAQAPEPPPLLGSRRAGLPAAADEVLGRALAASPAYRYGTCREFAAELRRAFGLDPVAPAAPAAPSGGASSGPPGRAGSGPPDPAVRAPAGVWRPDAGARGTGPEPYFESEPAPPFDSGPEPYFESGPAPRFDSGPEPRFDSGPAPRFESGPEPRLESGPQQPVPAPWRAGPPTGPARSPAGRRTATTPGLLESPAEPAGGRRRRRPRGAAPLAALVAIIVVAAVAGYYLLGHHPGHARAGPGRAASGRAAAGLTAPGCSTSVARAPALTTVESSRVTVGGRPFAMQETPDGSFTFVTVGNGIAVLRNGAGPAPTLLHTIHVPAADNGLAITPDGRYLLAAGGDGAVVISVAGARQGAADPVLGRLAAPHGAGAVGVAISPDGKFAFVTLQGTTSMAVFNLAAALTSGFGPADFVGDVPLGVQPVGIAASPDGKWLYVTSFQHSPGPMPAPGTLSVVSMHRAETRPATSVVSVVSAGCSPARVITDGRIVWVTARDSDTLLAFSAARLTSDPAGAILAEVRVGLAPIGLTFANGTSRIVVADSGLNAGPGQMPTLAVVSVVAALAGRHALLGIIQAGPVTRQVTLADGGNVLLAASEGSGQLQAVDLRNLP